MAFYDPAKYQDKPGIFMYTLSTCVHCKNAKKLMHDLGAEYDYVDVDQLSQDEMSEALSEMSKYNPAETFPTIVIGDKVIVGDRDSDIRQAVAKLRNSK
ncbi:glutaredoxin family protein [Deltaproteobacteria bacterium Smac51]|nr:glutaredoxin family protein [Deltaproteobacteria bacterium Smac51]